MQQIGEEFGPRLDTCYCDMIAGIRSGDIEQAPLAVEHFVQFRFLETVQNLGVNKNRTGIWLCAEDARDGHRSQPAAATCCSPPHFGRSHAYQEGRFVSSGQIADIIGHRVEWLATKFAEFDSKVFGDQWQEKIADLTLPSKRSGKPTTLPRWALILAETTSRGAGSIRS
jgi:hypothetical protein